MSSLSKHCSKCTPYNKDQKCLDHFGWKSCSPDTIQFQAANYQPVGVKYNFTKYNKYVAFIDHIPQEHRIISGYCHGGSVISQDIFPSIIGCRTHCCQVHLYGGSYVQGVMAPILGIVRVVQKTVENLLFSGRKFSKTTDDSLHMLKTPAPH